MSEKYTKLFYLSEQEQSIEYNIPIKIMAGALLLNNQQQNVIAQIKFKNTSQKSIKSVTVGINAFDKNGLKVKSVKNFEYTNLIAGPEDCFGDKTPIPMADNNTCAFEINIINVEFSDGTVWNKNNEVVVNVAKNVGKQTADITCKVAKRTVPFIFNIIIFTILLFITIGMAIVEITSAFDIIALIGFALMTLVSFPAFGSILAKQKNGKKMCIIRWIVVVGILILLFIIGRIIG